MTGLSFPEDQSLAVERPLTVEQIAAIFARFCATTLGLPPNQVPDSDVSIYRQTTVDEVESIVFMAAFGGRRCVFERVLDSELPGTFRID